LSSCGTTALILPTSTYVVTSTQVLKLTENRNSLVFRWLAIPWLQKEADAYMYSHNTSRRRANRHKVLPNGIPDVMFENPETVDARDFKVS
jgi:hypothetical protein